MFDFLCLRPTPVYPQRIGHMNRAGIKTVRPLFNRTEPNGFIGTKINNKMFLEKHWADLLKPPQPREPPRPAWFMMPCWRFVAFFYQNNFSKSE